MLRTLLRLRRASQQPVFFQRPRLFAFASLEEAAAERRRRKRRMRIEPPSHALQLAPRSRPPAGPPGPDTVARLIGPRLSLHIRVQGLIRVGDLDGASSVARHSVYSSVRPTVFTCNAIAAAMLSADVPRPDDAAALFQFFFRQSGIFPDVGSYNILIKAHFLRGRVDDALAVYDEMVGMAPFSPSAETYRLLTKGLVDAGRIQDAHKLLREMLYRGHAADSHVFNNLIAGYIDLGDWEKALELFKDLKERCPNYDGIVHTTFMEAYWKQGKDKEAMASYYLLMDRDFIMPAATYNVLLETLSKHEKYEAAEQLWKEMNLAYRSPVIITINSGSYNAMVDMLFKQGRFMEAIEEFNKEVQPIKIHKDTGCYNNIMEKLCENGLVEEAEKIYEKLVDDSSLPDVYTYTILVDACFRSGRVDDALCYFKKMADPPPKVRTDPIPSLIPSKPHSPRFSIEFFNKMFDGLTKAGRIEDALVVYGRMEEKEVKPNILTYEILLAKLLEDGDMDKARLLVQDMVRYYVTVPYELRTRLTEAFKEAGRGEEIEQIFSLPRLRTSYQKEDAGRREPTVTVQHS